MVDFATILAGFGDAFTLWNLLFVIFGVVVGQFVGAVPGPGHGDGDCHSVYLWP